MVTWGSILPNALVIKIVLILVSLSGAAFVVLDYINTKEKNAVLEASLESTTAAFANYAHDAETEIDAWSQSAQLLSEKYQISRDERDEQKKRISQTDFEAMARRHPEMLARRINAGTERVFSNLERITRSARNSKTSNPPTPGTDNAFTD